MAWSARCSRAAISAVYERCARTGEWARERLLYEELRRLAREQASDREDGDPVGGVGATGGSPSACTPTSTTARRRGSPTSRPRSRRGAPLVLFDLAGLPDALAGPVMLTLVDFIDRDVQRRRAHHLAHPDEAVGPWAGRAFVAIDEAWKPLLTPAAGAWLNEWARRTRHLACALLVITQHLADFANAQGEALLRNSVLRLFFRTSLDELAYAKDALSLEPEHLDAIAGLETRKGEYSTCFLDSEAHGRGQLRVLLGDIEYWACSADPQRDQPVRATRPPAGRRRRLGAPCGCSSTRAGTSSAPSSSPPHSSANGLRARRPPDDAPTAPAALLRAPAAGRGCRAS